MKAFDFVSQFARVLASSINTRTRAPQVDLSGIGSLNFNATDDEDGEVSEQSEMFGALGVLGRPLPPARVQGRDFACEALCMRTADGLVPISWRDLRLDQAAFPQGMPEGRIALAGYKGAFHAIDVNRDSSGVPTTNSQSFYVPFAFDGNGVPQKAMAIALDATPGSENVSIAIGGGTSGFQITMNETDGLQVRTPDAGTVFNIREDEINLAAKKIMLKGNVYVGAAAELGLPLVAGPASPPCPSLFVSPQ